VTDSDRGDRTARNATALSAALVELGLSCAVEARGKLVLLMPDQPTVVKLADESLRRAALVLAKRHGFTHAAIELPSDRRRADPDPDATVLRD
jgi:hypothetical protein